MKKNGDMERKDISLGMPFMHPVHGKVVFLEWLKTGARVITKAGQGPITFVSEGSVLQNGEQ